MTKKSGVNLYFKIDKFTKQRILLSTATATCSIYDALEMVKDIKARNGHDSLIKVNIKYLNRFRIKLNISVVLLQPQCSAHNLN